MWMKYLNGFFLDWISPVKFKIKINTVLPFDESYTPFIFIIINQQSCHENSKNMAAGTLTDAVPASGATAATTKKSNAARKLI